MSGSERAADGQTARLYAVSLAKASDVRRTYLYRLCPNPTQAKLLAQSLETHRRIYNTALAERKDAYEQSQKTLRLKHQYPAFAARRNAAIAEEKAGGDGPHWWAWVSAVSMRDTVKRLDKAFDAFFRRVKAGEKPGYPRFRGRDRYDSIPWDNYNSGCALVDLTGRLVTGAMTDDSPVNGYRLKVFSVGKIRVRLHRPIGGRIKTVTVIREAEQWYVAFSCDLGEAIVGPDRLPAIGIDVGLKHFLTTSDGETVENPRHLKVTLPELRRRQRVQSRRFRRGKKMVDQSKRFRKACRRSAKLNAKVKNQRKDHHHKTALNLVRRTGVICAESLNIRGMLRNGKLARAISDAAWGGFLLTVRYKAESAGGELRVKDARGTSQECSGCGETVPKTLSERTHRCPHCGLVLDRDHNAALNILQRGLGLVRAGPAGHNRKGLSAGALKRSVGHTSLLTSEPPRVSK